MKNEYPLMAEHNEYCHIIERKYSWGYLCRKMLKFQGQNNSRRFAIFRFGKLSLRPLSHTLCLISDKGRIPFNECGICEGAA